MKGEADLALRNGPIICDIVDMNTKRTARNARMTLMPFDNSILALGLSTSIVMSC